MHFVEQLLGACRDVEPPAGSGSLRHLDASIGPHIGQRTAQAGQVIDLLLARIGETAAGQLTGAFEQVAHQRAVGKFRLIVIRPTEGVQHRTEEQCRIAITVNHLPPGTSEWNRIEHKLFAFITMNCAPSRW